MGWDDINLFYNNQRSKYHDIGEITVIHFLNK